MDWEERLRPQLREGDLKGCERQITEALLKLDETPFHLAISLDITNDPSGAADYLDRFWSHEISRGPVATIYAEMNRFEINCDRWFFDVFAYSQHGGHDDYDWLAHWQSETFDDYTLEGLEPLQKVFASDAFGNDTYREAGSLASWLVLIRFQKFMGRATARTERMNVPLLATAHDEDFIAEFRRKP